MLSVQLGYLILSTNGICVESVVLVFCSLLMLFPVSFFGRELSFHINFLKYIFICSLFLSATEK